MLWPDATRTRPRISSPFGWRIHPVTRKRKLHAGVDLIGFLTVCAIADGTVERVGTPRGWYAGGTQVWVRHRNGDLSRYLHLQPRSVLVHAGQRVSEGQPLGAMGRSGLVSGVHLHLEVVVNGVQVDPVPYITSQTATPAANETPLTTTTTAGDEEMLQNIKGKAGKRSGGTWLLKDGKAVFLGHDPKNTAPYLEDEDVIRKLAKHYAGLPV